jgi:hypothetical protein
LASVGDQGCGIEQQLESVYRALKGADTDSPGFLRDDAILVVLYLTDEDDCSVASSAFFDDQVDSYRCVERGYRCDGGKTPSSENTQLTGCVPIDNQDAADPKGLTDVRKYIDFFRTLKGDPKDVILMNISAPATDQVSTIWALPEDPAPATYSKCTAPTQPGCARVVDRACSNAPLFADPSIRLQTVIDALPSHSSRSICADSYDDALATLGTMIKERIPGGCLNAELAFFVGTDRPDCVVEDMFYDEQQHWTGSKNIRWCGEGAVLPCYRVADDPRCASVVDPLTGMTEHPSIVIDRDSTVALPPRTRSRIECSTIAW